MIKTYTYKLKPNKSVERKFNQWLGTCRFVYNCSKDLSEQSYKKGVSLSGFDIANQLVPAKKAFPWVAEVHSQTLQGVIERYSNSMKKFFKGAGYPKWASKKSWKSVPFKSIKTTHNAFKLPSFGVIKVNPAYTSQRCNSCGDVNKESRKTQSIFECVSCGYLDNADLNAANNILEKGQFLMEAKVAC